MTDFEILLVAILVIFGIIPIVWAFILEYRGDSSARAPRPIPYQLIDSWYYLPNQVPWRQVGGSTVNIAPSGTNEFIRNKMPQFSTIHCNANQTSKAKWRLEVEFEIRNTLDSEIVIDDIHARRFESRAFERPLLTISYFGDVWLRQDNTILKEHKAYSLAPGDGYRIRLLIEASRVEGAPAYNTPAHEAQGRALAIFGLILDYYINTPSGLDRHAIPSDCLYLFLNFTPLKLKAVNSGLSAISLIELKQIAQSNIDVDDQEVKTLIQSLNKYLREHLAFRATPIK